jgi:metallo-beta-lactamase class B
MMVAMRVFISLLAVLVSIQTAAFPADDAKSCESCDGWNASRRPFRIFGNTYYVGVAGLSAALVTSDAGHILLDGALPQSAPLIDRGIRELGFRSADIRLIVTSHAHYDHVGGVAALQRATGADVAASEAAARALRAGEPTPDDPQFGLGRPERQFPPVTRVRVIRDGETLRVGPLAITAHFTPGHTPGGTSWTWRSCESARCLDVVYADSLNAVSAEDFRFTAGPAPTPADLLRRSIDRIAALPCDVIVSGHPSFTGIDAKLARRSADPSANPFVDPEGCRTYAADARRRLETRVAGERRLASPASR